MVVSRASGVDLASILKRNTFLTLGVRPAGGPAGTGGHGRGGTPVGTSVFGLNHRFQYEKMKKV